MPIDPDSLRVRYYPDPVLRLNAKPIVLTDEVRAVARRMFDLMRRHEGIGLAAPQVGLSWRMFVTHVPAGDGRSPSDAPPTAEVEPSVYINPVLSAPSGDIEPYEEGCLSLPDIRGDVLRHPIISVTAIDLDGRTFTRTGAGLLARCWQHEMDHLDGVLILDRMSQIHRMKSRGAVKNLEREWETNHRPARR